MAEPKASTFLDPGPVTSPGDLAILHLRRDNLIPTVLSLHDESNSGYAEGKVSNTRFGSFPHSTLIDIPWGSQVRASAVDTGSRGRAANLKRKRGKGEETRDDAAGEFGDKEEKGDRKVAKEASSGFVHVLAPTPERWTTSLPHRTQVVYTPDYGYILHRISARAGTRLIEAGAGSGSFTHAAVRSVFNGFPYTTSLQTSSRTQGKVFSYEFHSPRYQKMIQEIKEHGLSDLVELTHRDVCSHGFDPAVTTASNIQATAIFLDLPAPWLALPHLNHSNPDSPLSRTQAVKLCTFSPCIEQVQRTITALRTSGWVDIRMEELSAKRIEVRRDRIGGQIGGGRGGNDVPADVKESLERLSAVEKRARSYQAQSLGVTEMEVAMEEPKQEQDVAGQGNTVETPSWREGRLVTRSEADLRTHTSYLVFAVLPRPWSEEDEMKAQEKWAHGTPMTGVEDNRKLGKKARKRAAKAEREAAESKAQSWANRAEEEPEH